jgi:abhydrolase domain-containing protein 6
VKKTLRYLLPPVAILIFLLAIFPEETATLAVGAERSASGLSHRTIVIDGETWHYLEGGPTGAEVLLLLHGFGGDKDNWTRFSRSLTETYRVIAPDLPGFGESAWHPNWDYSMLPQRGRVESFVQALNLEKFHVVGNSMGGNLAALVAHKNQENVISLALINNAGVTAPVPSDFQRALLQGEENWLIVDSLQDFDDLIAYASFKKPFVPWPVKGVFAQQALDHAKSNRAIFESYKGDRTAALEPILEDIKQPVLIVWGDSDRILNVSSIDVMRPLLPQAKVIIMKDTGHIPMIERPLETAEHFLTFIESH